MIPSMCAFRLSLCLALLAAFATTLGAGGGTGDVDSEPRLAIQTGPNMEFGLRILKDQSGKALDKRLTYSTNGDTNSTVLRVDGKDYILGGSAGAWVQKPIKVGHGHQALWAVAGIEVRLNLELAPGKQPVEIAGVQKRLLHTCLVRYELLNKDSQQHKVELRLQLDTMIGSNDGVPFAVPGLPGVVNTLKDFKGSATVPDFIQALEKGNLQDPGTVAHLTLKVGGQVEPPARVTLTRWPGSSYAWEVPVTNMERDSAVVMYWHSDRALPPGGRRELGFAYGLGSVSSSAEGDLRLTIDGQFEVGKPLNVLAYVNRPQPGQSLTLKLPPEFERLEGKDVETVPAKAGAGETSTVTWRISAKKPGRYTVSVASSSGREQSQAVVIEPGKIISDTEITQKHMVEVPLIMGLAAAEAKSKVTDKGLLIKFESSPEKPASKEKQFTITAQQPAAGTKVEKGTLVTAQLFPAFEMPAPLTKPKTDFTMLDAQRALKMAVKLIPVDLAYDLDTDGRVTSRDAVMIMRRALDTK